MTRSRTRGRRRTTAGAPPLPRSTIRRRRSLTKMNGSARFTVEVVPRSWGEPALGDGDDQDHAEAGPVAGSTSDTTGWERSMPASRSVVSTLLRALGDFSLHPQGRPCGRPPAAAVLAPAAPRRPPGRRPHRHRSRHRHRTLIDTSSSTDFGHAKERGPGRCRQRRDLAGLGCVSQRGSASTRTALAAAALVEPLGEALPDGRAGLLGDLQQEGPQRLAEDLQEESREQPPQGSSPHAGAETD